MPTSYEPSGSFRPSFFAFALLVAGLSVGIGWLYQWAIGLVPLIVINVVFTAAFAGALFVGMKLAVERSHCRNRLLAVASGLVVGLVGLAASHYFDYLAALDLIMDEQGIAPHLQSAVQERFGFWEFVDVRVEEGYEITRGSSSSGSGLPLSGVFVYLVWGVETIAIAGAAAWGGFDTASLPYCETCERWAAADSVHAYPQPTDAAVERIEGASTIESVVAPEIEFGPDQSRAVTYEVDACPDCDDSTFLSVTDQTITYDSDGNEEIEERPLWTNLEIDSAAVESLSRMEDRVVAAAEAQTETGEPEETSLEASDDVPGTDREW